MDTLAKATELEREAQKLRQRAYDEKREKERREGDKFLEETKVRTFFASDYAGLNTEHYEFYYGYESRVCPEHGNDSRKCEDCDSEWAFVAIKDKTEIFRLPQSKIHPSKNEEPEFYLLMGVGHFLSQKTKP